MEIDDRPAVKLSEADVLQRFMTLLSLDAGSEDLRSLGGLCDRRFLQAATRGIPAEPSFADALAAHRIVAACYRSAAHTSGT